MRMIDADKIIKEVYENPFVTDSVKTYVKCSVVEQPTIDAVEVVRCRDCKYQNKGENESESWNLCGLRPWLHVPISDEHFCSWGERKDGEAEDDRKANTA